MFVRLCPWSLCIPVLVVASGLTGLPSAFAQDATIIDHNCTTLERVPAYWIEQAKNTLRLSYGHTSHGSQPISGMNVFKNPSGSLYWWDHDGTNGGLSLWDYYPSGDLGNPDYYTWEVRTRAMLDDPGCDRNCVVWSWCGQADTTQQNMQIYLDLMTGLINDYPDVTFVYMTGHLNGTGVEGNLNARNNQIRDHVIATGGVLFDFADIESYDPDGNGYLHLYANDNCDYWLDGQQHNWAIEWCDAHPGECSTCSCAHSQSLNCDRKGRAYWWMLARIAGWPSGFAAGDLNCDGAINGFDIDAFVAVLGDVEPYAAYYAQFPDCDHLLADINGDLTVDAFDIDAFVALLAGP
ncbi:MAG: hypothetical protein KKB50_01125 [Planctomycetes bacterium]|nr:hypothetical protein [Planctomycetota bacterium]